MPTFISSRSTRCPYERRACRRAARGVSSGACGSQREREYPTAYLPFLSYYSSSSSTSTDHHLIFPQLDAASEAFEKARASHDSERLEFTTSNHDKLHSGVRLVDESWQTCFEGTTVGLQNIEGELDETTGTFGAVAQATSSGVLERAQEVEDFSKTMSEFTDGYVLKELAFQMNAVEWPVQACKDYLHDVEEDKRVLAVLSLEKIDAARKESRAERRSYYQKTFGKLASDIELAREADGERILKVRERCEVWDRRLGIELGEGGAER